MAHRPARLKQLNTYFESSEKVSHDCQWLGAASMRGKGRRTFERIEFIVAHFNWFGLIF